MTTNASLLIDEGVPYNETCTVYLDDAAASDTGWSARLKIARMGTAVLTLTEGVGVTTTPHDGSIVVDIAITAAQTAAFDWERADYQLDLLRNDAVVLRPLQDQVLVTRDVVR